MSDVQGQHHVQADEMKSRSMKRRPTFLCDLVSELKPNNSIFVEIMDKKFYLATNLVTFALYGRAFNPLWQPVLANQFADVMTEVVKLPRRTFSEDGRGDGGHTCRFPCRLVLGRTCTPRFRELEAQSGDSGAGASSGLAASRRGRA